MPDIEDIRAITPRYFLVRPVHPPGLAPGPWLSRHPPGLAPASAWPSRPAVVHLFRLDRGVEFRRKVKVNDIEVLNDHMIRGQLILQRSFGFYTHFLAPGDKFLGGISSGGRLEYILNGRGDQDVLVIRADILINLNSIAPSDDSLLQLCW